jgi:AraC-like DNA-binding protein
MDALHELRTLVERQGRPGLVETSVPGLTLYTSSRITEMMPTIYRPLFCLIVGGAKRMVLGDRVLRIAAGDCFTVSVDLPVSGQVIEAPYTALALTLDPGSIAGLLTESPRPAAREAEGLEVDRADPDLLDAVLRLARLLERPSDVPILAPLIEREVFWRLLHGHSGPMLRQITLADSRLSRVNRAITWLRTNFTEPVRVDRLAGLAGMSPASFHRHFKAATAMSPLQYLKQIRLHAARTRLLAQPGDVAGVGFSVGYESASQFSREYARLFGAPPGRDAARLRQAPDLAQAVA